MLVWNAMSEIMEIFSEMVFMASAASPEYLLERFTFSTVEAVSFSVAMAFSVFWSILATISSMAVDTSSALAACSEAPLESFCDDSLSCEPEATSSLAFFSIATTVRFSPSTMPWSALAS